MDQILLYGRAGCHLCDDTRDVLLALIAERVQAGIPGPTLVERDIDADPVLYRAYFDRIPVVELGGRRVELATSATKLRRLLAEALDGAHAAGGTT
jgi:hypothetical protein